jgi:hypothetical protein
VSSLWAGVSQRSELIPWDEASDFTTGDVVSEPSTDARRIRFREALAIVAVAWLLAIVVSWPLVLHADRTVVGDLKDPLLVTWVLAWEGHALETDPSSFYQSNALWPERDTLAFTESFAGYAPAAMVGEGPRAAVLRYNAFYLFSFALAFVGAYLLARELDAGWGSWIAGAAFALAPFRIAQNIHLHVLASGAIPLTLFLLIRGVRRRSAWMILAGWIVATWQLSIGFTFGVPLAYILGGLVLAFLIWTGTTRPWLRIGRNVFVAGLAGAIIFFGWAGFQTAQYLRVAREHPSAVRTFNEVRAYSPPPRAILAAAPGSIWGPPTERIRRGLDRPVEKMLFPGLATTVLALMGVVAGKQRRRIRFGLASATIAVTLVSFGSRFGGSLSPYRLMYLYLPGWNGFRTPGRLFTFTTLLLAVLASLGAARLASLPKSVAMKPLVRTALIATLMGVIFLEGAGATTLATVPSVPSGMRHAPSPQYHLPATPPHIEALYMYWSTDGFPLIANGYVGFRPKRQQEVEVLMRGFPDAGSMAAMRMMGVRTVVLHLDLVAGTPWESASNRSTAGLPLRREQIGDVVLYHLQPGT